MADDVMQLYFDGETFCAPRDGQRLAEQMLAVARVMRDGNWRTLEELSVVTGAPQASVSARLRDLRKARYGAHKVERTYLGCGLHAYRVNWNWDHIVIGAS